MSERLSSERAPQRCRQCGRAVETTDEHFPFCSKRCRTKDLAKWADGQYVISRPIEQSDLDED